MGVEVDCEVKNMDRISFHNHTYLRPTLPFRFPPFPELRYTHTQSMPPGSLTSKIAPDVTLRVSGHDGTPAKKKNLKNSGKYLWSGSGLKWLRAGEVEVKPLQL